MGDPLSTRFNAALASLGDAVLRLTVGFFTGLVVAKLGLMFLGYFVIEKETTIIQERMLERSRYWDVEFAVVAVIVTMFVGRRKISTYWLWFALAFGAICLTPVLPSKGGALLPFGTPYVNEGHLVGKFVWLTIHVGVAAAIAWFIHGWNSPKPAKWSKKRVGESADFAPN